MFTKYEMRASNLHKNNISDESEFTLLGAKHKQ